MSERFSRWWARLVGGRRKAAAADELSNTEALASGLRKLDDALEFLGRESGPESPSRRQHSRGPRDSPAASEDVGQDASRWGQLTLRRKLGVGGFAEVYLAHDDTLDRDVALKLRRFDERTEAETVRGFLAEARRLAKVRHPNVLVVHGADVHDGRVGIWTDLIEGKTLEEIVSDLGPLGPGETASIGRDLCRALAAVHEAGLLHGDIKPGNVMREVGGRIVLMDFGAGLEFQTRGGGDPVLGYGTALNAAPEVLEGHRAGVTSDIYSVGVLLFFLLTGEYPVEGESLDEVRAQHRKHQRRSLTDLRPQLPSALVHLVERALSPDPAQRFASVGAVESALSQVWEGESARSRRRGALMQRLAVGAVAALVLVSGWTLWRSMDRQRSRSATAVPAEEMVVLTPLITDGDQESELLALAISDYLGSRLREAGLPVLAPNEVERIVPSIQPEDVHDATRAGRVVSGQVRARADGGSDVILSVHQFDDGSRETKAIPVRQIALPMIPNDFAHFHNARQSLVEDVVLALAVGADLPPDGEPEPTAPDAYRLALSADRLLRSTLCDSAGLEGRLQQALAQDPHSSHYWWLLANHYFTRVWGCGDPIALLDEAFAAAARADELAPEGPSAQAQLRHTYLLESTRTEDSYELALEQIDGSADGAYRVALSLRYAGFLDEAEKYLGRVLSQDPIYFYRGNYGRAPNTLLYRGELDRFLSLIPESGPYHSYYAGYVRMLQGDRDGARQVLSDAFEAFPSDMFSSLSRALFAVLDDQPDLARVTIRQLAVSRANLPLKDGEITYKQAQLLVLAEDTPGALENLAATVDQGFFCVVCIEQDPVLSRLAVDPAFNPIVARARDRHLRFAERFDLEPQL